MLRLSKIQKNLKKIIKRYKCGEPGNLVDRNLCYGALTIHAIGHWAHDLSIDLAKQSVDFKDVYRDTKEKRDGMHMSGDNHNRLWDIELYDRYDVEEIKKGGE